PLAAGRRRLPPRRRHRSPRPQRRGRAGANLPDRRPELARELESGRFRLSGEAVTLISAVLTSDYAVLASDRRVAWLPPARPPDDHRNKMILLCGHFVMGYSGLGEVAGRR